VEVFRHNKLPEGTFLLSQIKRWFQLVKTGKTKHHAKLLRIMRILQAFPNQKFVLFGDNSQSDPMIYSEIASKHPEKIFAVYLRNIKKKNEAKTREILDDLEKKGIKTFLFEHSKEAMQHSVEIGLVDEVFVVSAGQ
jgi:phosphatidate phosphatase APP1